MSIPGAPADATRPQCGLRMRMVGGELGDVASDAEQHATWTALLTCFFVDACPSVISACEHARKLLRPHGVWLNIGPLLYHWNRAASSVPRLCADELLALVESEGFEVIESGWRDATYSQVCHVSRSILEVSLARCDVFSGVPDGYRHSLTHTLSLARSPLG